MQKRKAKSEFIKLSGSQIYRERRREGASIVSMLQPVESIIDLGAGLKNEFLVGGLLGLGTVMGIGMVAVLIWTGWLQ